MPFFFRECDVERFLRDYVEEKEPEFTERRIAAEVVSDLKAPVYGSLDTEQMIRVFDNLMENACKYANRPDDLRISIHIAENDGWIVVDFGDNGDGMEQEKLGAVFDEFYRGDESRRQRVRRKRAGTLCMQIYHKGARRKRSVPYTKDGFSCGDVSAGGGGAREGKRPCRKRAGSEKKRPCRKRAGREKKSHAGRGQGVKRKGHAGSWQGVRRQMADDAGRKR